MNNILKQAKEIEKGCGKKFPICWNQDEWLEIKCGSEFSGKIRYCLDCKEQATKLLKIAREGCEEELWAPDLEDYIPKCGIDEHMCKDCQEAIKILGGILK